MKNNILVKCFISKLNSLIDFKFRFVDIVIKSVIRLHFNIP